MERKGRYNHPEKIPLEKKNDYSWTIPRHRQGMRVPCMILANKQLLEKMQQDRTLQQCINVSHLPGIYKYALTLPDFHSG